jgi:hypothetical protein
VRWPWTEKDDLSPVDRRTIAAMIKAYRQELESEFSRGRGTNRDLEQGRIDG